jgi:hypothetical protein
LGIQHLGCPRPYLRIAGAPPSPLLTPQLAHPFRFSLQAIAKLPLLSLALHIIISQLRQVESLRHCSFFCLNC